MAEYINREQTIELYYKSLEQNKSFISMLQKLPSVEIVRCKDCKFRNNSKRIINLDGNEIRCKCDCIGEFMLENNFCSYGERKE